MQSTVEGGYHEDDYNVIGYTKLTSFPYSLFWPHSMQLLSSDLIEAISHTLIVMLGVNSTYIGISRVNVFFYINTDIHVLPVWTEQAVQKLDFRYDCCEPFPYVDITTCSW
jgi:hypothetical protein